MAKSIRRALYPGSFDPVTYGHIDVINRARKLFDEVYVAVAINSDKNPLFSTEERVAFIKRALGKQAKGIQVEAFSGLIVHYAKKRNIYTIIRGLRATSDFDYEFQMALTNRMLERKLETIFLMPSEKHFYLSSRLIKEISAWKGNVSHFVPPFVQQALATR